MSRQPQLAGYWLLGSGYPLRLAEISRLNSKNTQVIGIKEKEERRSAELPWLSPV